MVNFEQTNPGICEENVDFLFVEFLTTTKQFKFRYKFIACQNLSLCPLTIWFDYRGDDRVEQHDAISVMLFYMNFGLEKIIVLTRKNCIKLTVETIEKKNYLHNHKLKIFGTNYNFLLQKLC